MIIFCERRLFNLIYDARNLFIIKVSEASELMLEMLYISSCLTSDSIDNLITSDIRSISSHQCTGVIVLIRNPINQTSAKIHNLLLIFHLIWNVKVENWIFFEIIVTWW